MRMRIKIKVTFIQGWESIWIFLFDYLPCSSIRCNFMALGTLLNLLKQSFQIEFNTGSPKKHLSYQNYLKFLVVFYFYFKFSYFFWLLIIRDWNRFSEIRFFSVFSKSNQIDYLSKENFLFEIYFFQTRIKISLSNSKFSFETKFKFRNQNLVSKLNLSFEIKKIVIILNINILN